VIKIEKYTKLILNDNIFTYYCDKLLKFIVNQQKYFHNDLLIKIVKTIHITLLIKIRLLILNNLLVLYEIYDNIIKEIELNTILKWIQYNTPILEELMDKTMKICIDTSESRT